MKKRILALALAGTTAFSVFGAAISANAATSTDVEYQVDAYVSYEPVAKNINISTTDKETSATVVDEAKDITLVVKKGQYVVKGTDEKYDSIEDYIKAYYDVQEEYVAKEKYTFTPEINTVLNADYQKVTLIHGINTSTNAEYIRIGEKRTVWGDAVEGKQPGDSVEVTDGSDTFKVKKLSGTYYMSKADYASVDANGNPSTKTVYYKGKASDELTSLTIKSVTDISLDASAVSVTICGDEASDWGSLGVAKLTTGGYTYEGAYYPTASDLLKAIQKEYENGYTTDEKPEVIEYQHKETGAVKSVADFGNLPKTKKIAAGFKYEGVKITVSDGTDAADYTEWTFNSDMTGDAAVTPFKTETTVAYDDKGNPYLKVTKEPTNTVYAYDFIYNNPEVTASAGNIATAWANKDVATLATLLAGDDGNTLEAEEKGGVAGRGIRYDVISEWEAFLSELTILNDSIYDTITDKDEFKGMYLDRFYNDPVYNKYSGFIEDYKKVDLYNINGLLDDIWALRKQSAYYAANTSEMVYLMQQYDKYIGDYIDQEEVSTDEWGDLLVDLLNSATADDFKTALDYNRYVAEVSRLTANYQNALTAAQVNAAEKAMYELLVNNRQTGNYMFYTSGVEKDALVDTMEGLYFNVGTAPVQYSVAPSTPSDNVDFYNYNYFVATPEFKGNVFTGFKTTLTKGYYSLYPMDDYLDYTGDTNKTYPGNTSEAVYAANKATDEYEWFWNVYQLAANMNKYSKFQGQVDAVNDALNAAVAELAVVTTPSNVDTGALADSVEKYEGKIDTDYNKDYYAKYTQANEYAENVAEGKWQTRIAAMITGVAGEALTYQGTQVTVTKNDMKTVEEAIKNGETALKAIKEDANYNAAQVTALNKAISDAQYLVDLYEGTYSKNKDYQSVNKVYTYLTGDKDQMVKSDLTNAIEAIDAAINYSEIVMGWSKNEAGKWMYGTEEGYLSNGWNKIGSTWFYFNEDGTAKQSEWLNENGTWYWFNSNCGAATGWAKVDGEWYFFKGNNAMKTGWEKVDGNWYYMASSGKMVTGWCEIGGKWYYFSKESNSLGQMLYNTTVDGYKLDANGVWVK